MYPCSIAADESTRDTIIITLHNHHLPKNDILLTVYKDSNIIQKPCKYDNIQIQLIRTNHLPSYSRTFVYNKTRLATTYLTFCKAVHSEGLIQL